MMIPAAGRTLNVGARATRTRRQALLARGVILGSGLLVLALLAWVHLGVGALLFPPAPGPEKQVARAGTFQVTLVADSGELLVGDGNTVSLLVSDATGRVVPGAQVAVDAGMLTMPMPVPPVAATWAHGRYTAHPVFSMAGPWRLTVTIRARGQPPVHATFKVGVRWHA